MSTSILKNQHEAKISLISPGLTGEFNEVIISIIAIFLIIDSLSPDGEHALSYVVDDALVNDTGKGNSVGAVKRYE